MISIKYTFQSFADIPFIFLTIIFRIKILIRGVNCSNQKRDLRGRKDGDSAAAADVAGVHSDDDDDNDDDDASDVTAERKLNICVVRISYLLFFAHYV